MFKLHVTRFLAFPILAFAGQWYWVRTGDPTSAVSLLFWVPLLTYCWFCVGGLAHELVHENLMFGPRASRILGTVIGTCIGIPHSVYREVHMRHHAYLNTPLDFELWPYSDPHASLGFRRVFVWFDMLCGSLATPLIWSRICFSAASPVSEQIRSRMRREYALIAVTFSATVALGTWMHLSGRVEFRAETLLFALPPLLAANCNSVRKLMEHIGTSSFDPLLGTRTVVGDRMVTRLLSYFDFDIAVHGPHHRHPNLPHTELKSRMQEIQADHPETAFPVYHSFTSALLATFRTAIRNPAVGVNAGCTDDLSHLPGMQQSAWTPDGENLAAPQAGGIVARDAA